MNEASVYEVGIQTLRSSAPWRAQTEAASMNKIIDQSGSSTPVIGFTVCYAISNVLLAVCGPIIVFVVAG